MSRLIMCAQEPPGTGMRSAVLRPNQGHNADSVRVRGVWTGNRAGPHGGGAQIASLHDH